MLFLRVNDLVHPRPRLTKFPMIQEKTFELIEIFLFNSKPIFKYSKRLNDSRKVFFQSMLRIKLLGRTQLLCI